MNGKDLSLEIQNFLENKSEDNKLISPPSRKIKQLESEVKFHANQADNYLERLNSLEAELDNKDLEIKELKTTIHQLKKEANNLLEQKEKHLTILNNELNNLCFLNEWFKTGNNWKVKQNNLIQILMDNLPLEEIKQEFGDVYQGWESDIFLKVLTKEDQQKIVAYDELEVKDLPKDWKEQLRNLKEKLEKVRGLRMPRIII